MFPKYPKVFSKSIEVGGKTIKLEIGKFSEQTAGAVLVTCGETVVHTTVALGRPTNLDYFPLSVEFSEKLYAAGMIKGSRWVKRDGRPLDDVILKARVIDRSLRPLFPDGIKNEVQVINTVFSYDGENDPDMLGLLGSAIAVAISEIPFDGPMAGLRVGYNKESQTFLFNPTDTELETSELDLIVSGSGQSIVMVEAGAKEVAEDILIEALTQAQDQLGNICQAIEEVVAAVGKPKANLVVVNEARAQELEKVAKFLDKNHAKQVSEILTKEAVLEPVSELIAELVKEASSSLNKDTDEKELISDGMIKEALYKLMKTEAREMIVEKKKRPDGRKIDEIRPIWCEVDLFPRTHGSAMFKRGATQAVTVTTLGSPTLGQNIESIEGMEVRRYMHHYNMPPYASGEAGRFGFPKRREIGHGALAERALIPVLPDQEKFPYAILVVSEILSSNGSTSQASVCGSTLSLMAAGVPITRPVAGIAMGLMSDGEKYVVLSDIQGLEDHIGDMDFKVAGTSQGVTALQMDIKLKGLSRKILEEALAQAQVGRLAILEKMLACIAEPRKEISQYAPKIFQVTIPAEKIGELIGPGGKMIKSIIEKTGAEINVDEDEELKVGLVTISSADQKAIDHAAEIITGMTRVVNIGDEFDGTVTRVEDYGIFAEYLPNREGLVHVSNMAVEFVADPGELYKIGDAVHVRIREIKEDGKIGLSLLTEEQEQEAREKGGGDRNGGERNGSGRSGGDRRGGRGGGYRDFRRPRQSGGFRPYR